MGPGGVAMPSQRAGSLFSRGQSGVIEQFSGGEGCNWNCVLETVGADGWVGGEVAKGGGEEPGALGRLEKAGLIACLG